jgi:hypothetical protein
VQTTRIFHLGGAGRFEYVVSSLPHGSDNWRMVVRGKRPTKPSEVLDEELVEYANCRDEIEAVKRYINKYGPPYLIEGEDKELLYADTLGRWRTSQRQFRESWDRMLGLEIKNDFTETYGKGFPELWKAQAPWVKAQAEGEFQLTDRGLLFLAKTHFMALVIKLLAVSATGKLRKCLNPSCPNTPYFIADHGKVQYCSEECGKWGQRQAKLKYWHENKQTTRKVSKPNSAQVKGGPPSKTGRRLKDVTKKAR